MIKLLSAVSGIQGQRITPAIFSSYKICYMATPLDEIWVEDETNVLLFQICKVFPELYKFCPCQKHVLNILKGLTAFKNFAVNRGGVAPREARVTEILLTGLRGSVL